MAELAAGHELDALVAEKVMGRARFQPGKRLVAEYPLEELSMGMYAELLAVPRYSTDIAAAWQIVERMRGLGWQVVVATRQGSWQVQFLAADGRQQSAATADLVPLAICRAALAALESGGS